jgi:hypothetical protein
MKVEGQPTIGTREKASAISAERRTAVEGACRTWINRLIDPSRRNNLLFFRELREGTLDLSSSPRDALAALISPSSSAVKLADLVSAADAVPVAAKLQEIRKRAVINLVRLRVSGGAIWRHSRLRRRLCLKWSQFSAASSRA